MLISLPSKNQLWGNDSFSFLERNGKFGIIALATDFSSWLGAYEARNKTKIVDGKIFCAIFTSSKVTDKVLMARPASTSHSASKDNSPRKRTFCVRPVLTPEFISQIPESELQVFEADGKKTVLFGSYPQKRADKETETKLNKLLKDGKLKATGNEYTIDGAALYGYDEPFSPKVLTEYEFEGKRYVCAEEPESRIQPPAGYRRRNYGKADAWFEVEPVEWLVETKGEYNGYWMALKGIASGIKFSDNKIYDGDFLKTVMYSWLNNHFLKDITQNYDMDIPCIVKRDNLMTNNNQTKAISLSM